MQIPMMVVRLHPVFFSLPSPGIPSVKLRILEIFTLYLRNSWSLNLRAIENCICGLRSIERNMRFILRTVWQFGAHLFQTFWVMCDSPLLTIMVRQKAITICKRLSHPTRSLSRKICRGQEHSKGRKGTLRPDFQANTRARIIFFTANVNTRYRKTVADSCEEIQV